MNRQQIYYQMDHRYNSKIPNIVSIHSENLSKSNVAVASSVAQSSETVAAAAHNQTKESSFHNQINNILGKWRQLQEEKKQCQQQQQQQQQQNQVQKKVKHPESIDFDQIMEEDLANQLEELERQEKEQYKRMEQTVAKELKVDEHSEQIDQFMHDYIKQLESFEQLNNKGKINELFHRAQNKIRHLNIAELKQSKKEERMIKILQKNLLFFSKICLLR
jgi:hypothetical protein